MIIGGPPRIGKTQIAMLLATDLNAFIISLDRFKSFFSNLDRMHVETAKYEMLKIFCNYSGNIIIEGDELITHQPRLMRERFKNYPIAIPLLKKINLSLTSYLYIAGVAEYSVDEKVDHIYNWAENNECWLTSNLPKEKVASYTSLLIKTSADLKILSNKHGIKYIEMRELNTQQAVEKILNDVESANSSHIHGIEHNSFSFTY